MSVINGEDGNIIAYDNIPLKPKDCKGDEILKIHYIASVIVNIAKEYKVTHISVENSYMGSNSRTAISLSRLYGGVTTLLIENGFELIYTYVPSTWRKEVTGVGNKTKEGCYNWLINNLISKEEFGEFAEKGKDKNDDIVDAILIGYCLYKKLNN